MGFLTVLVIDDEPALRQILYSIVSKAGYAVDMASGVTEGMNKLKSGEFDVALCDIKMQDGSGIDLLRQCRESKIDTVFVMVTAYASLETAVETLRAGAYDYVVKPVHNNDILHRLSQIEQMRGLRDQNLALREAMRASTPKVYRSTSPVMLKVERLAERVAPTDSTVLLRGESGTGKGVWARTIHELSDRSDGPFVSVNCSAIPEQLLESELFGHNKGAFTGADRNRKGLFLEADHGTLFLDEIGELPLAMQTKLLHVIEDKQVRALGGERQRQGDCRIIAATNRDLSSMIKDGTFREDLYFRLNVIAVEMPPLRRLEADVIRFADHYAKFFAAQCGRRLEDLPAETAACIRAHSWPGNLRELRNAIERAVIMTSGDRLLPADFPAELRERNAGTPALGAPEAKFCLWEAKLGLSPATISPYVVRAMGERARRLEHMSGRPLRLMGAAVRDTSKTRDAAVRQQVLTDVQFCAKAMKNCWSPLKPSCMGAVLPWSEAW